MDPYAAGVARNRSGQAVLAQGECPGTAHRLINAQRTACRTGLTELDDQLATLPSTDCYGWLVYEFHRTHIAALLAWLDTCTATLAPGAASILVVPTLVRRYLNRLVRSLVLVIVLALLAACGGTAPSGGGAAASPAASTAAASTDAVASAAASVAEPEHVRRGGPGGQRLS